jgi:hypothetical protein
MSINPKLPAQSYPFLSAEEGSRLIAPPWYDSLLAMARAVAALGPTAFSATIAGWGASPGGARGVVNGGFVQAAAGAYSQADTQAVNNQVQVLSKRLAQLITDLEASKVLGN